MGWSNSETKQLKMAATLLRNRSVNTQAIKYELEATLVVYEVNA